MFNGSNQVPHPRNEPVLGYAAGSYERIALEQALGTMAAEVADIPNVVGGEALRGGPAHHVVMPHAHRHVLARVHYATPPQAHAAVEAACKAREEWASWHWHDRAAVLLKAADLLAGPWRARVNASTMLGQSKTAHQSEIDAACELADFWRFNVAYAGRIYAEQPSSPGQTWNRSDYRPLDGFVFAVTPFNFTSIAGNLPTAPALMGNTVVWKPSHTQALSAWVLYELLREAGLPPGVVNLVHGAGADVGEVVLPQRDLAGIHFTGSTRTFQHMWRTIGTHIERYASYPRLVGETGGKDFILAHASADPQALAVAIARGGFEYQGQKCSAASRVYLPRSLWPEVRDRVAAIVEEMHMGDVRDFSNFLGAVIDDRAFGRHAAALDLARRTGEVVFGGGCDDSEGWFVEPTLVRVEEPDHELMREELFGPIVTAYVYDDAHFDETIELVDETSPYALTGAVFSQDRAAVRRAMNGLRHAAGNFYVNDKPTGAVVDQQPFGGSRSSGTNDKAGSLWNLIRWTSPRSVKENFVPPHEWRYPFLDPR